MSGAGCPRSGFSDLGYLEFTHHRARTSAHRKQMAAEHRSVLPPIRECNGLTSTFHSERMGTEGTSSASDERAEIHASPRPRVAAAIRQSTSQAAGRPAQGSWLVLPPADQPRNRNQIVRRPARLQMHEQLNSRQRTARLSIHHWHPSRIPASAEAPRSLAGESLRRVRRTAKAPDAHQL